MTKRKHDNFFRSVFSKPENTAKLLRLAAKRNKSLQHLISLINLDTLQEISEAAPREGLSGAADVAFQVNLAGNVPNSKLLIGLVLEHKAFKPKQQPVESDCSNVTAPDPEDISLREQLLKYYFEVMYQKVGNIPVVAIVVYSGDTPWDSLAEKPYPDGYPDYFQDVGLPFKVEFINIGTEIQLEEFNKLDPLMKLVLIAMRLAFNALGMKELFSMALDEALNSGTKLDRSVVEEIIVYLGEILPKEQKDKLMVTDAELKNKGYTSVADVLREEGREEGRNEGSRNANRETARKMITKGKPIAEITEFTDLSESDVLAIKSEMGMA